MTKDLANSENNISPTKQIFVIAKYQFIKDKFRKNIEVYSDKKTT